MIIVKFVITCDECGTKSNTYQSDRVASRRWVREVARLHGWTNTKPRGKGATMVDLCPNCQIKGGLVLPHNG